MLYYLAMDCLRTKEVGYARAPGKSLCKLLNESSLRFTSGLWIGLEKTESKQLQDTVSGVFCLFGFVLLREPYIHIMQANNTGL